MKSTLRYIGGPVMPAVELARGRQILSEVGILQVPDAGRLHAGADQRFVEPGRHLVAEVHADRGLDRIHDQHEHEHHAGQQQADRPPARACWTAPTVAPMATAKTAGIAPLRISSAHQTSASTRIGFGQYGEELPLLPRPQPLEHGYDSATRLLTFRARAQLAGWAAAKSGTGGRRPARRIGCRSTHRKGNRS